MAIHDFRNDGRLPEGVHLATEAEVTFRFGAATPRRRQLALRLRRWIELVSGVSAKRFLVDGSFVTAVDDPADVDAVVWLDDDFSTQVSRGDIAAVELEMIVLTRRPEEIYAADNQRDWDDWVEFFSRTREPDGRRKGLVEIEL